jgi:hypothetical protein
MKQETNNEMDLLLRRLGGRKTSVPDNAPLDGQHLDADELSAYAENVLPPAARARYTEHLAECSNCRRLVAQLSASFGAVAVERAVTPVVEVSGFKKFLQSFFSPVVLRYAVPAIGLIAITTIALIVFRSQSFERSASEIAATNTSTDQKVSSPSGSPSDLVAKQFNDQGTRPKVESPAAAAPAKVLEVEAETKSNQPKAPEEQKAVEGDVAKKDAAPAKVASVPQPVSAGNVAPSAGKPGAVDRVSVATQQVEVTQTRQEPPADASGRADQAKERAKALAKAKEDDRKLDGERPASAGPAKGQWSADRPVARRGQTETNERNREVGRDKSEVGGGAKNKDEDAEVRSVAGRQFRREGNAWIDTAYSSSRATTNVTRGSDQFRALVADEPPLRTIADQLSGEVIVVWKGRAYRIR